MKNVVLILALLLTAVAAHALSQEQIAQMVSQNPALLNSPQAQAYMSKQNPQGKSPKESKANLPQVENNISNTSDMSASDESYNDENMRDDSFSMTGKNDSLAETQKTDENLLIQKTKDENMLQDGSLRLTPLQYKSENAIIKRIKSAQTLREHKRLKRFSNEFFRNKNKIAQKNISTPKDYTLSRGDELTFWIYGKNEKNFSLVINNEGNIDIPEVGPVRVAGERFADVKELLTNYLSSSYKNSKVVVNLDAFSNAQVTVTGFVNAPGIYNTTSVSSVKDILIEAHGVGDIGSVRDIYVKRDGKVIANIDYYHLLAKGLTHGDLVLKPNDTIYVPRAHGLVSIEGAVYKEAIYEIEAGESLAHILRFAGGLKAQADGYSIQIKRYSRNTEIQNLTLTMQEARRFKLKDGDEIYVDGLNITNDNYILITGNVVREGKREFSQNGMRLSTLLHNEIKGDKLNSFFLEDTRFDYAMIKRIGEDLQTKIFHVNLQNVLDGQEDFLLENRDELYVFNTLDTGTAPFVTISGDPLIKEGKYIFHEGMTISDLINQAGVKSPYDQEKVKIVSKQNNEGISSVNIINMENTPEFALHERDAVTLFNINATHPLQTATISGEVVKSGSYEVSDAMNLMDFIESAGGLSEKAYPKECEIIRYHLENGERKKKIFKVALDKAASFLIQQHDQITIKRIPNWYDRQTVTLSGEVKFPGTYVIHSGEKLDSVIKRAGGFTKEAFLYGSVFTRKDVQKLQKESLHNELSKLKEQVILINVRNSSDRKKQPADIGGIVAAVDSLIKEAKKVKPKGRITINLEDDLEAFKQSPSNLVLKDQDTLDIPSFNDTIIVNGEVMQPSALTYKGDNINTYIRSSGGLTHLADSEHIYVIHANGEARKADLGSFLFSSNDVEIQKGDVIVVPKQYYFDTRGMDITKDIADIFYKISLTVAAAHTVGAL